MNQQDTHAEKCWETRHLELELDDYGQPDRFKVLAVWVQEAREELAGEALRERDLEQLAGMRGRVRWVRARLERFGQFSSESFVQAAHLHQWERDLWWLERELGV